jgi:hypothetical protein
MEQRSGSPSRQARRGRRLFGESPKLSEVLIGHAPITTKQFVKDFKAAFS